VWDREKKRLRDIDMAQRAHAEMVKAMLAIRARAESARVENLKENLRVDVEKDEKIVDVRSTEDVENEYGRIVDVRSTESVDRSVPRAFIAPGDVEIEQADAQTYSSVLRDTSVLVQLPVAWEPRDETDVSEDPVKEAVFATVAESSASSTVIEPIASTVTETPPRDAQVEATPRIEQPRSQNETAPRIEPQPRPPLRLADPEIDRVWIPRDVRPTVGHVRDILAEHPEWVGVVGYDSYRGDVGKRSATPWGGAGNLWSDVDTARMRCWISDRMRVGVSTEVIEQALIVVGDDAPYHSLADEIRSFAWDGAPRLYRWLSEYMLAEDNEYHREVGRRYLVQAVARAMKPGCKADQVLVLEGKTGARKSSAIEAIAGRRHYSASRIDLKSNFVGAQLLGVWFYEFPEMSFIRANDVREVTGFITLPFDDYAPKNVKRKVTQMRTCVFAGTTEDDRYLRSNTNRRFWPVKVGDKIRLDEIARDREQLIAEATWLYDNDYQWHLDDEGESLARDQQEMRRQSHAWEEPISNWMAMNEQAILDRGFVTVAQILGKALKKKTDAWDLADEQRVADILAVFGWRRGGSRPEEPYRRRIPGVGRVYPYYPPDAPGERTASPSTPVALCAPAESPRCDVGTNQERSEAYVVPCAPQERDLGLGSSRCDAELGQLGQ
jgi:hypothetical protein